MTERRRNRINGLPRLLLAVEAMFELTLARLATVLPERRYFKLYRLQRQEHVIGDANGAGRTPPDAVVALMGRAVGRVAGTMPFRAVCLQQSLATCRMLRRRGFTPEIVFGLFAIPDHSGSDPSGKVLAHAWVIVDGQVSNGWRNDLSEFAIVGRYV